MAIASYKNDKKLKSPSKLRLLRNAAIVGLGLLAGCATMSLKKSSLEMNLEFLFNYAKEYSGSSMGTVYRAVIGDGVIIKAYDAEKPSERKIDISDRRRRIAYIDTGLDGIDYAGGRDLFVEDNVYFRPEHFDPSQNYSTDYPDYRTGRDSWQALPDRRARSEEFIAGLIARIKAMNSDPLKSNNYTNRIDNP